jgi:trimeric autotransporter adhesin
MHSRASGSISPDEGTMQRHIRPLIAITFAMGVISCEVNGGDDDGAGTTGTDGPTTNGATDTETTGGLTTITTTGDTGTDTETTGGTTITTTITTGDTDTDTDTTADTTAGTTTITGGDDTTATTGTDTGGTDTGGPVSNALPHEEAFDGPNGASWPAPWTESSGVISAELTNGRGYLQGHTGQVGRMVRPGFSEVDVDATVTVEFDDWTQQGFGLYVRQNGGALTETVPPGQGYAAYVEGGFMQTLGVWRELDGVEELLAGVAVPGGQLQAGVPYHLRLQCYTEGDHTRLRTRLWPAGEPEPLEWHVSLEDDSPALQQTAGSFALDVYNYAGMGGVHVDDLYIESM